MATGLYSGVSGLAIGVGLNKGVTGLWSGASGLIAGWGGGFNPLSLFAAGEPGAWYDPSDLSTMFQDTAGTTPVTATGQTVGLLLDKSKGLVLGPELVSVGGWTLSAGITLSGSSVVFSGAQAQNSTAAQDVLVAGRSYLITFTVSGLTQGSLSVTAGTQFAYGGKITTNGTYSRIITGAASTSFNFQDREPLALIATVSNISVKELPGNHATQATAASRPIYQVDGNGKAYLLFDGTDDFLLTGTITPGIDKAQVFAGVRKLSDATIGALVESSANSGSNTGALAVTAPAGAASASYLFQSRGTAISQAIYTNAAVAAPITNVLTGIGDIAGDVATLRVNGVQTATSTADQGTGNYLAYPLYIGRRAGTSQPFNGRIYQMLVRFGANLSAATITQTENYTAGKTGIYTVEQLIRLNTLNASGVSYNAYAAADSNGNNYPVTNTVLAADGTPYSVL